MLGKRYKLLEIQIRLYESSKEKEERKREKLWNTKLDQESLPERRGFELSLGGMDWIRLGRGGKEHPCWRIAAFVKWRLTAVWNLPLILGKGSYFKFYVSKNNIIFSNPKDFRYQWVGGRIMKKWIKTHFTHFMKFLMSQAFQFRFWR